MIVISVTKIKEKFIFLLPTLTIVLQRITIAGINLSWLISGFLLVSLMLKRNYILQRKIPFIFIIIFLITPFLTVFLGRAPTFNFSLYVSIATGVIYFLYVSSLEKDKFEKFMAGGLFSCVFFALWGCYEIFTGNYILSNHEIFTQRLAWNGMHYPIVAFPNTNDIAQYLTLLFPITSLILFKKSKIAWIIASLLVFFVVYVSGSRLSMMCFLGVWALSLIFKILLDKRKNTLLTMVLLVVGLILGLLIVEAKTGIVTKVLQQFLVVDTGADYYSGRAEIYMDVLAVASKLPFGGFGSSYVANDFPPHNFILFVLCDYGWYAMVFLCVVLLKFVLKYFQIAYLDKSNFFVLLLLSMVVLFPILSSVSSANEQRKIVWIILGIFMNQYLLYKDREKTLCDVSKCK